MPLLQDLDIVNAACAQVGETPLQSMDDETDAGQSASLLYEATLEFNLGIYVFSFSKQIRQLSRDDTAAKLAGYLYVYDLPAERLGDPLYLTDDPTDPDVRFAAYAIVGTKVHTDAEEIFAMIRFSADVHHWTPTFKMAMITSLAAQLAISLCHDRALSEDKHKEAYGRPDEMYRGGIMGAAIRADAFSTPPRKQNRDANPLTRAWQS